MSYINIPTKDNSTPFTPAEFNYLIDKINNRRLRDVVDVQDSDPSDGNIIKHNGSGWVYYKIGDDFYTKEQINSLIEDLTSNSDIDISYSSIVSALGYTPEEAFEKNTAFNKDFGTEENQVAQGNDTRINNGQTAYDWGDHNGLYSLVNHTHTFSDLIDKPTTIEGYGVTNVYNKTEIEDKFLLNTTDQLDGTLTIDSGTDGESGLVLSRIVDSTFSYDIFNSTLNVNGGVFYRKEYGMYGIATGTGAKPIIKINSNGTIEVLSLISSGAYTVPDSPYGLVVDNSNNAFVLSSNAGGYISKTNLDTLVSTTVVHGLGVGARGLAIDNDGVTLYASFSSSGRILKINTETNTYAELSTGFSTNLNKVTVNKYTGELFAIEGTSVWKVDKATGAKILFATVSNASYLRDIDFNIDGSAYLCYGSSLVAVINQDASKIKYINTTVPDSNNHILRFGYDNFLYLLDVATFRMYKVKPPSGYVLKTDIDGKVVQSTYLQDIDYLSIIQAKGDYEGAFSKNTAFNKSFGTSAGTVMEGNDSRVLDSYDKAIINTAVTGTNTKTLTLTQRDGSTVVTTWSDLDTPPDGDEYIDALSFNSLTGVLSAGRTGALPDITASLDGRYSLLNHTHTFASLTSKPTTIAGYGITDFNTLGDARWLLSSSYTAADVLTKIKTVDGSGSGLDADLLRGVHWGNVNTDINTTGKIGLGITGAYTRIHAYSNNDQRTVGGDYSDSIRLSSGYNSVYHSGAELQFANGLTSSSVLSVIKGTYSNLTSTDAGGSLNFYTRNTDGLGLKNRMIINHTGNVGIGTTSPSYNLDVTGSGRFTEKVISGTGTNGGFENQDYVAGHNNIWRFASATEYGIGYYQGGSDYIGMHFGFRAFPQFKFYETGAMTATGNITAHDFVGSSDERLKENIENFIPKKINSKYKTFNFIGDADKQERIGVIAQELEETNPEFIRTNEEGIKSVSYSDLHSAEIAYLKSENEALKRKLDLIIKKLEI